MSKRELLDETFDLGQTIIAVNGTYAGVVLPNHLLKEQVVNLRISRQLAQRLDITDYELTARLSFNKEQFDVVIPLNAIFGLFVTPEHLVTFTDCLPQCILDDAAELEKKEEQDKTLSFQDEVKSLRKKSLRKNN